LDNPVPVIATSFVAALVLPHLIHPLEFSIEKHSLYFILSLVRYFMGNQLAIIELEIE